MGRTTSCETQNRGKKASAMKKEHLLWCLYFLKNYATEDLCALRMDCTPKTFRKWVWKYVKDISFLTPFYVSFATKKLMNNLSFFLDTYPFHLVYRSNLTIGTEETFEMIVSSQSIRQIAESLNHTLSKRGGRSAGPPTNLVRKLGCAMNLRLELEVGTYAGVMGHSHAGSTMIGQFLISMG